jgi:hypothetical protein
VGVALWYTRTDTHDEAKRHFSLFMRKHLKKKDRDSGGVVRFGTWNMSSLYRSGSLKTVARDSARYKLDLVGGQEMTWDKGSTVRAGDFTFFLGDLWSVLTKYYLDDQIKKNEICGTCSTYGGEERCIQDFGGEIWGKETTWKTQAQMGG